MTKSTQSFSNLVQQQMRNVLQQQIAAQQTAFSLDQEKIAHSSSSQPTIGQAMQTPVKVSIFDDYGDYKPSYIERSFYRKDKDPRDTPLYGAPNPTAHGGTFSSCSAEMFTNMGGIYLWSRERREEFVVALFNTYHNKKTIYFLPTTVQMKRKENEASVLNLLFELGAVEVYTAPNNQPGHTLTNLMHLCVLNCGTDDFRERCLKYICRVESWNKYKDKRTAILPRFILEKNPDLKELPIPMKGAKNPPVSFPQALVNNVVLGKPLAKPLRDQFGRFLKKVQA